MVLTKEQKRIANQRFYKNHAEKLRNINREKESIKYKGDEEFRRLKINKVCEKQYAINALLFIRKLYT